MEDQRGPTNSHPHFLSALQHAARLGDDNLNIYPCPDCDGLHVGHSRTRKPVTFVACELPQTLDALRAAIRKMHRKIARLKLQEQQIPPSELESTRGIGQRIRDMRLHVRRLEGQFRMIVQASRHKKLIHLKAA